MRIRIALFVLSVAAMAAFGLFTQARAGTNFCGTELDINTGWTRAIPCSQPEDDIETIPVGDELSAVYGIGTEPCGASLKQNWQTHGEAAWIGGYMSLAATVAPRRDLDPWHKDARALIALVYHQCKHDPAISIGQATSLITGRILVRQSKEHPQQQEEINPNESLEQAPM